MSPLTGIAPAPIRFRRASARDRAAVEALQRAAYARNRRLLGVEPLPLKADYGEIFERMEVWLAEERDKLKGVLILELRKDDLLIWSIAAAPDAQGQGLGEIMLDAAAERARLLGHGKLRLYTGAPLTSLIGWYQHHGFVVEGTEDLPDRTITHMVKDLTEPKLR
jgi:GNAT superfamily N-acetyltransferase